MICTLHGPAPSLRISAVFEKCFEAPHCCSSGTAPELTISVHSKQDADNPLRLGQGVPVLPIDLWEHAYYLGMCDAESELLASANVTMLSSINVEFGYIT